MLEFKEDLQCPLTDLKKFFTGVILAPIVPLALGYQLKCASTTRKKLPEWTGFKKLFLNGLYGSIISLAFVLPSLLVFLFVSFLTEKSFFDAFLVSLLDPGSIMELITFSLSSSMSLTLGFMVSTILFLFGLYLTPLALTKFALGGKNSLETLEEIFLKSLSSSYLLSFLIVSALAIIVFLLFVSVSLPLFDELRVYLFLAFFLLDGFFFGIVLFNRLGRLYHEF